jgi:membrane protease YdiL (CAAX protease family)
MNDTIAPTPGRRARPTSGAALRGLAPILAFFAIAYAIAWGLWLVVAATAAEAGVGTDAFLHMVETQQFEVAPPLPGWLLYAITRVIDFAFSIAGVIVIAATAGTAGLRELGRRLVAWRFGVGWYLVALLPVLLFGLSTALAGAAPAIGVDRVLTALISLEAGLLVSLVLRGAMGEELGLRGFALPWLQERMSPFRASLVIGLGWGLWHLPVLMAREPVTIVLFLALAVGLSFLFTLMFNGTRGSLIPGLLFHATQNWEEGFETFFPALVGTTWETPSTFALLAIGLGAGVYLWVRGRNGDRA